MLLYDLIEKCSYRDEFQNEHEQCEDCSYGDNCPGDCQKCMQYVHYPQNAPVPRKYDCVHMADCYYCKYAYKYASEITYGLACFAEIRNKKTLKIMSVGCGPCTELAAVDYLKEKGIIELVYIVLQSVVKPGITGFFKIDLHIKCYIYLS